MVEMAGLQEAVYVDDFDYEAGSPHLRHPAIRLRIVDRIHELVAEQFGRTGRCRVLEVGGGHGAFTEHVAATGAQVTVTEMSRPSLVRLRRRFAGNDRVRLVHDDSGERVFGEGVEYDLVLCVSVLHHIPDYLGYVERLAGLIPSGGAFAAFQDPLWYPRRGRLGLAVDRGAYYAWRVGQGELRRGLGTLSRRVRRQHDEGNPADMVEYHVVRSGVDERRLTRLLGERFEDVTIWRYFSTQSALLQAVLGPVAPANTFGLTARKRW